MTEKLCKDQKTTGNQNYLALKYIWGET